MPPNFTAFDDAIDAHPQATRDPSARVPARRARVVTRQLVVIDDTGLQVIPDGFGASAAVPPKRAGRQARGVDQTGFLVGHVRLA